MLKPLKADLSPGATFETFMLREHNTLFHLSPLLPYLLPCLSRPFLLQSCHMDSYKSSKRGYLFPDDF